MATLNKPPIFIVACPRSGTTLLANILNSHSNIAIGAETHFFNAVFKQNNFQDKSQEEQVEQFFANNRIADFCKHADISREDVLSKLDSDSKPASIFAALMQVFLAKQSKARWAEKTPQHLFCVKDILEVYPEAKIIHVLRDGRDVVNSLMKMPWRPKGLLNNARFWNYYVSRASKLEKETHAKNFISIKYEDLLTDAQAVINKVCQFIDEPFEAAMLEREGSSVFSDWENEWKQKASQDLDSSRVNAWQEELDQDDQAILNFLQEQKLKEFGYQHDKVDLSAAQYYKLFSEYAQLAAGKFWRALAGS